MALTIGANRLTSQALRNLASSGEAVSRSFERLSSGQRINRASDDAAGISIVDKLRSDAKLQTQAIRNVNDGISVVSIVDSAIASQVGILQRMNELSQQSANGTYSTTQRDALSREFIELRNELSRIAETTTFNGLSLLSTTNGISGTQLALQAGINGSVNALLMLPTISTGALTGSIDVSNMSSYIVGLTFTQDTFGTAYDSIQALEDTIRSRGLGGLGGEMQLIHVPKTLGNRDSRDYYYLMTGFGDDGEFATGILFERSAAGRLTQVAFDVDLSLNEAGDRVTSVFSSGGITLDLRGISFKTGGQSIYSPPGDDINLSDIEGVFIRDDTFTNIDAVGVESATRARTALNVTSNRIQQLATLRGELGAVDSRLGSAVSMLAVQRENFQAAEGRIRNVDIAAESATLVARQISQQAALSVLAQASQQPQLALRLLQ